MLGGGRGAWQTKGRWQRLTRIFLAGLTKKSPLSSTTRDKAMSPAPTPTTPSSTVRSASTSARPTPALVSGKMTGSRSSPTTVRTNLPFSERAD